MQATFKAIEVTRPGTMKLVERPVPDPGPGQVGIRVEACGICHTDAVTIEGRWPGMQYPRVPGHEIVGRIHALGPGVTNWQIGQRVGVGWFGGECGSCDSCRRGNLVNCSNLIIPGLSTDGGYAEIMIAEARSLARIPDSLNDIEAAPLLCAGVTTFAALRNANLRPGDSVAVHGIGGLGHLAIQFARRMGMRTIAIARGTDKRPLALELGAHEYIDSSSEDAAQALLRLGGANAVLSTVTSGKAMGPLLSGLKSRGKLIVVGVSEEPIEVNVLELLMGSRTIQGETIGTPWDIEETLSFSALQSIHPMIELVPLEKAPEAYAKMLRNEARFRMVITQLQPDSMPFRRDLRNT